MNPAFIIPVAAMTIIIAFALYVFIVDFLIVNQNAKNKSKQERKKREEVERLFIEAPTGFLQRNCEERCYENFIDTQLMESKL